MVKLRLTRFGRHKLPFYRIVAIDSKMRRDGEYIECIGTYEPFKGAIKIDEKLALKFLHNGAQPTDTVKNILRDQGVWKKFHDEKLANKIAHNKAKAQNKASKKTA